MEQKRVTIRDIAEELGLSTATVSNVIHGRAGKVSDETVRRVQQALEEYRYIPSMAGILLARNNSRIIGVVVNDHEKYEGRVLEDAYVASSLNSLSARIEESGYFLMVKKTTDPEEILRFASMWNMEGLVLMGFCDGDYRYLRSHMRIPFVVYDGYCDGETGICNITIDNFDGGFQMGRYFGECGHEKALCVADNEICVDKERCDGFRAGFGREGAEFLRIPMHREERLAFYETNLAYLAGFSAIFAVSDFYALELQQFLLAHGVAVPEQICVAGFDDTPVCRLVSPALTSVRQDVDARARLALETLQALKENRDTDLDVRLPVRLQVRASTQRKPK